MRLRIAASFVSIVLVATAGLALVQGFDETTKKPVPRADGPTSKTFPELHNLIAVTDRIYSGGEPAGEEALESLDKLGVKTIVSVDAARPDVDAARSHGIRYIHIPMGYDGVSPEAGAALARVISEVEGQVYIHCHHGKHRGPAAAAIAAIASGAADTRQARAILEQAGTGKQYPGLWRDVAHYQPPLPDAKLPELREIAEVNSLAAAMAKLDRAFDELKLCQKSAWRPPTEHPDLVPRAAAALVREQLRESARLLADDRDARFKAWLCRLPSSTVRAVRASSIKRARSFLLLPGGFYERRGERAASARQTAVDPLCQSS